MAPEPDILMEQFELFLRAAYSDPPVPGSDQCEQLRDAFFAGAVSSIRCAMESGVPVVVDSLNAHAQRTALRVIELNKRVM